MILLFNPPAPSDRGYTREGRCTQEAGVWGTQWPPLSLATAAAMLRGDGFSVTLRDYPAAGLGMDALAADLRALRPALAIWSTGTPTIGFDLGLAQIVRDCAPEVVTAVLGTHVSACPEEALAENALDVVIRGEPEGVIRDLGRIGTGEEIEGSAVGTGNSSGNGRCRRALSGCADIRGISWRGADGKTIHHNPDAPPLAPEAIPAPAWDGLDLEGYRLPLKGRRFLIVAPVRGCPWRCTFCTAPLYYGHRLRRRPVARVVEEMEDNIARYGIREFFIWADTFTADRDYVRELCRTILTRGLRISWTCNSRVDTIDEETLSLMKEAGLWMISYGLESASDAILAASGKGITAAQSRAAVEMAHRLGIKTAGHFIFGLPGETRETMAETLTFALSLPLDIAQFYSAAPFPGTALYNEALEKGWLTTSSSTISQSTATLALPGLPTAEVDAFRRRAFRRFYLRPSAAARVLSMVEPGAIFGLTPLLRRFLRWIG
jgi:anaerobic magnesium-protoporphyrin IX monomethyl ester cyclase